MRADMKETEQSKAAVSVICIGQAVVDCITRGVEGDPRVRQRFRSSASDRRW